MTGPLLPSPPTRVFSDDAARHALAALPGPYLPWGAGAMRPAGLVTVCNDLVVHGRRRVVELGSGISTVLLARLIHQRPDDVRLVAVEHDAAWVTWVREQLRREGIDERVEVLHAPLGPHPRAADGLSWYDEVVIAEGLRAALHDEPIDLLLVDGPPAYHVGYEHARYPALPVLHEQLAPGATVVLDDVERPGEQEILRRWEAETGLVFDLQAERAGVAVARNGTATPAGPKQG